MSTLIVGGGSVGKRHLRNLITLGETGFGVVDTRADRRDELAREPGVDRVYADLPTALRDGYEVVVVGAPTAFHIDIGRRAIAAGAHVLMEKPLSHTMDGVAELIAEADRAARRLMVGYTYRFWPPLQRVKERLDAGDIGQVYFANVVFSQYLPDWHPWEDYRTWFMSSGAEGGGALLDESHTIDMIRWFLGEVDSVVCEVGNVSTLEMTADDFARLFLTFESGARATLHMDVFGRCPQRWLEFLGAHGNLRCDINRNEITVFDARTGETATERFTCERNEMFVEEVRHFLAVLRGAVPPIVSAADAAQTLAVALAGAQSSEQGARVTVTRIGRS